MHMHKNIYTWCGHAVASTLQLRTHTRIIGAAALDADISCNPPGRRAARPLDYALMGAAESTSTCVAVPSPMSLMLSNLPAAGCGAM